MCIAWTYRQRRLGIDEFGNPLPLAGEGSASAYAESTSSVLAADGHIDVREVHEPASEATPLLGTGTAEGASGRKGLLGRWLGW